MITHAGKDVEQGKHSFIAGGMQTYADTLKFNMAVPKKTGNATTPKHSYTTLGHIPKGHSILPQGYLVTYVHYGFIHNIQNPETTLLSLNRRMGKQNVVHNGVLLSC